jgi:hypothetical protein
MLLLPFDTKQIKLNQHSLIIKSHKPFFCVDISFYFLFNLSRKTKIFILTPESFLFRNNKIEVIYLDIKSKENTYSFFYSLYTEKSKFSLILFR